MRESIRHVLAVLLFGSLTIVGLWPLLSDPGAAIPGTGAGDNLTFVWNGWWMRQAISAHAWPFRTSMIFAPWGVDLTLHTHTALPSFVAALLSHEMSIVAATNVVVGFHLVLNFVAAYALAWRQTRRTAASIVAGLIFGWSPYVGAHLAGHFNLIAAWVLPLTALLAIDTLETESRWRPLLLGLVLGGVVFIDYYSAVYAAVLTCVLVLQRAVIVADSLASAGRRRARWQVAAVGMLAALIAIDLVVIGFIVVTGGTVIAPGGLRISMLTVDNPIAALGILLAIAAAILWLPLLRIRFSPETFLTDARRLAAPIAIAVVVASPLLLSLFRLWQRGDYLTQRYLWRSAPAGIDVATLMLGNPGGLLWMRAPARAYAALGIDTVEQIGWLGPGVIALCATAIWLDRRDPRVRRWLAVAAVFFVWAAGPYLSAFGHHVYLILPATFVRFIPGVANARIPARAMVVVYLAAAMLAAHGFAMLRARGSVRVAAALVVVVVLDYAPAPATVFHVDYPLIYDALRQQNGPGAVCELPLGLRDGFGERGRFDSRVLLYQTIHGRPITGGFVARLPPRLIDAYERDPVFGALLRLSEGHPLAEERPPDAHDASAALLSRGIRFIVIDLTTASPDLLRYVESGFRLRRVAGDSSRALYEIAPTG